MWTPQLSTFSRNCKEFSCWYTYFGVNMILLTDDRLLHNVMWWWWCRYIMCVCCAGLPSHIPLEKYGKSKSSCWRAQLISCSRPKIRGNVKSFKRSSYDEVHLIKRVYPSGLRALHVIHMATSQWYVTCTLFEVVSYKIQPQALHLIRPTYSHTHRSKGILKPTIISCLMKNPGSAYLYNTLYNLCKLCGVYPIWCGKTHESLR